jgi:hypothetical protein
MRGTEGVIRANSRVSCLRTLARRPDGRLLSPTNGGQFVRNLSDAVGEEGVFRRAAIQG